jgi:cytochrome c peroxidase
MASGVRPSAEAAVRAGMAHILFSDFSEADARSIDAYLRSLEPVRSPFLDTEGDSAAAVRRGRLLFERPDVGCARCHPSPLFTDRKQHDVGTSGPRDQRIRFDTPTLVEVWRTAPYLHDGRFATLRELLFDGKHGNRSGGLDRLTESEREDLLRYVLSL